MKAVNLLLSTDSWYGREKTQKLCDKLAFAESYTDYQK